MLGAGVAWGIYSLRGMGSADPAGATADNFLRAAPMALLLCLASLGRLRLDPIGCGYALVAGAVASGLATSCGTGPCAACARPPPPASS